MITSKSIHGTRFLALRVACQGTEPVKRRDPGLVFCGGKGRERGRVATFLM